MWAEGPRVMKFVSAIAFTIVLGIAGTASAGAKVAHLSGDNEVPAVETRSVGQAVIMRTGKGLMHSISVGGGIDGVVASHIHCAPEGMNGPVGMTVFEVASLDDAAGNGQLTRGPLPDPDPGNACGWVDHDDVLDAIEAGNAYVNVHTLDVLSGEIRGQLR